MSLNIKEEIELIQLLEHENDLQLPSKLDPIKKHYRYKMIHGGRGSGKSWGVAQHWIDIGTRETKFGLFTRETKESIKESVYKLLTDTIDRIKAPGWHLTEKALVNKNTKSKFVFQGLKDLSSVESIKSYEGYDWLWVEEAHRIKRAFWDILTATFRRPESEIWATFNRYEELDPVYEKFCLKKSPHILVIEINWRDNPWFKDTSLQIELEMDKADDYDLYLHKWENYPIAQLEKAVIPRKLVDEAMNRTVDSEGLLIVGVDMARFGGDNITFYGRRGYKVVARYAHKHQDSVDTCNDLVRFILDNGGDIYTLVNIDNGGLGAGGLIDMMRKIKGFKNICAINFGGTPKNHERYKNIATEMYFEIKELLPYIELPNIPTLKQDLSGRLYKYTDKQQRVIEPKKDFKDRYNRSPDDGDGCLLCFYNPTSILKISKKEIKGLRDRHKTKKRQARQKLIT